LEKTICASRKRRSGKLITIYKKMKSKLNNQSLLPLYGKGGWGRALLYSTYTVHVLDPPHKVNFDLILLRSKQSD
jgi:hypothetical protein